MSSAICGDRNRLQAVHALDFGQLVGHPLLERAVPLGEFLGLRGKALGLIVHGVVQLLDAQDRAHARHERGLVDRLGQVFIAADVQAGNDILGVAARRDQDDRDERQALVGLELAAHLEPVELGHHDVEEDQVGQQCRGRCDSASSPSAAMASW